MTVFERKPFEILPYTDPTAITIVIHDEDHTLGNALSYVMNKRYPLPSPAHRLSSPLPSLHHCVSCCPCPLFQQTRRRLLCLQHPAPHREQNALQNPVER